jgi:hypothetical protein
MSFHNWQKAKRLLRNSIEVEVLNERVKRDAREMSEERDLICLGKVLLKAESGLNQLGFGSAEV